MPTALVLALATFTVFRSAQTLGPESAVRRLVNSVQFGDVRGARQYVLQPLDSENGTFILAQARAQGNSSEVTITERLARGPYVIIVTSNTTRSRFDVWVVARSPRGWVVDADATINLVVQSQQRM